MKRTRTIKALIPKRDWEEQKDVEVKK